MNRKQKRSIAMKYIIRVALAVIILLVPVTAYCLHLENRP